LCAVHALSVNGMITTPLAIRKDSAIRTTGCADNGLFGKLLRDFVRIEFVDTSSKQEFLPPLYMGAAIAILVRVGGLVLENLDELVETCRYDGAEDRSEPVDPVVAGEDMVDNCWAEGASGIERTTGEVDAS
jgi:hypothetical protein